MLDETQEIVVKTLLKLRHTQYEQNALSGLDEKVAERISERFPVN